MYVNASLKYKHMPKMQFLQRYLYFQFLTERNVYLHVLFCSRPFPNGAGYEIPSPQDERLTSSVYVFTYLNILIDLEYFCNLRKTHFFSFRGLLQEIFSFGLALSINWTDSKYLLTINNPQTSKLL